jgi:hypothetical protein
MSKISEQKALEAYPIESHEFYDCDYKERNAYAKGYEQATQDFLEKAMEYLEGKPIHPVFVEGLKEYITKND